MRKHLGFAVCSLALVACEDGPTQTYAPAPPGAGDYLNGTGSARVTVDPSAQGFDLRQAGTNKQEICDAPTKQKRWAKMVTEPIIPPLGGAGLDLSGGQSWQGLTIEEAEKINCQSESDGDQFGDGNQVNSWGDGREVWFHYRVSNRKGTFMVFWPGYLGTVTAKSRANSAFGNHTYVIPVNTQVQKDGQPFTLDWHAPKTANDWRNELFDALMATFAPGLPADPNCNASRRCIQGAFGDVAYFYIPAIGHALWTANQNAAPPTPSIPNRLDQDLSKVMPFAFAAPLLKLDAEGPTANAGKLGALTQPCVLKLGLKYADFLSTCVKTTGDAQKDQVELNKLLGGLTHGTERFHFDITGVDVNFTDNTLPKDDIVHDADKPTPDDTSTQFRIDQSTLGRIANDYTNNDVNGARDLHGSGMVYLEYARLVQSELNRLTGGARVLGDPQCTAPGMTVDTMRAHGCTGFEGFVTSAPVGLVADANMKKLALGVNAALFGIGGMKPGHHVVTFCNDATGNLNNDYADCPVSGDTFPMSYARVLDVLGKGKVANLPTEVQDVRFFFKQWFIALVKYLKVASDTTKTLDDVHAQKVDPYNLFFDSIGAGQFEIAEYVDRSAVTASQDPSDIVFVADVRNGIMNSYEVSRDILRGEGAMYASMIDHRVAPNDPPGKQDTALLTNMFGSPVLAAGWSDHTSATDTTHTAYYCATHMDVAPCAGQVAPTDANGNMLLDHNGDPILKNYEGAFGDARTAWTLGTTPIKVQKTYPNIQSAMIRVPLHTNPYDLASAPPAQGASMDVLVPWLPKQPGVGFPISLTGTRDKFVETYQLDLSGTTITANIDYDFAVDPNTHQQLDSIQFLAVETTDFLGDVFLCQDPNSGDLLAARMYSSVATILDWFTQHPGAYAACQMVVRYSPYGNYADYITSLKNGVRLGITQGGGYGRVVDATLFVPGQ